MITPQEKTELSMMTVALGQAIGYSDVEDAKRMQKMLMDWIHADDDKKRAIYHAFRNEGSGVAGLENS